MLTPIIRRPGKVFHYATKKIENLFGALDKDHDTAKLAERVVGPIQSEQCGKTH